MELTAFEHEYNEYLKTRFNCQIESYFQDFPELTIYKPYNDLNNYINDIKDWTYNLKYYEPCDCGNPTKRYYKFFDKKNNMYKCCDICTSKLPIFKYIKCQLLNYDQYYDKRNKRA